MDLRDSAALPVRVERVTPRDGSVSRVRALFSMMAAVFDEADQDLGDAYLESLLAREDLWVLAAFSGDDIVGGLTAHVLPMTRNETRELFVYDLAVRTDHQRRGVGRLLMDVLQRLGADAGIRVSFVAADDEDQHALDFYRAIGGVAAPVTMFTFEAGT